MIVLIGEADISNRSKRHYLASADSGHPYRWLWSAIWMTLVSYIDCLSQPIREEYSPSFFTCQLLPLIIINHPSPRNNHFLYSLFSFHPQATMPQRVNMGVKAKNIKRLFFKKDIRPLLAFFYYKHLVIRKKTRIFAAYILILIDMV